MKKYIKASRYSVVYDDEPIYEVANDFQFWFRTMGNAAVHKFSNGEKLDFTKFKDYCVSLLDKTMGCKMDPSTLTHPHNIGNNNVWQIYYMDGDLKVIIGYILLVRGIYGDLSCGLSNLNKEQIFLVEISKGQGLKIKKSV